MTDANDQISSRRSLTQYIKDKGRSLKPAKANPETLPYLYGRGINDLINGQDQRVLTGIKIGQSKNRWPNRNGHLALPAAAMVSGNNPGFKRRISKSPKKRKMSSAFGIGNKKSQSPASKLYSKEELSEYQEVFELFDTDGSGSIGYDELKDAMTSLGLNSYSHNELEGIIREIDVDGNGEIDFEEFCMVMRRITERKDTEHEMVKLCFDYFDKDGDGVVSYAEFRRVFDDIGGFTVTEVDEIFREADVAGNHRLDYDEFTQMVRNYMSDDGDFD